MSIVSALDQAMMAKALQLAAKGTYSTHPNPRVGCVITINEQIIASGWHKRAGEPHAELEALNCLPAGAAKGATVYVTLEPCSHHGRTPPCSDALVAAGVRRVVIAMEDPNPLVAGKGIEYLQAAGIDVICGVLEAEAKALNAGFIKRMCEGLPYVRCKAAMSLDGATAMENGESQWITGPAARVDVHKLRAKSAAVITGIGTVLADDPALNVRLTKEQLPEITEQKFPPVRVLLDSQLRIPLTARLLHTKGKVIIVHSPGVAIDQQRALREKGIELWEMEHDSSEKIHLTAVLKKLAQAEINDVLLEAGARLAGAFLAEQLIDELVIYTAPVLMGSQTRPVFYTPHWNSMLDKVKLKIADWRQVGDDWRLIAYPAYE
ncbi:bifunctional diaminohydroxyphosphoribosylaminopyrimidine deaminase/5-amino-6-(5-phosphoribosylamino)uracil reductase RibD [Zooshikella marina]|uniref:bifunctional diaminohydroxyphosphoribosylaminopyrimidine deaminase/5-amino-6-(5-phosphoribosylamino)uracil reductase RibD n=1 Tax=Zooshikella ganghwensis TaxID=202772 RepID=UPI001BAFF1C2|nr:bifunctional diaminohydroxyphosphoribosylaminopyrimidine deaminase/5-amino-6-(5-phosphoribosylamino)uracil reductase RibD [Zooshikella ganghwensis]MBU2707448.1 bifunctional diaminohydroxyphosphoribosylaminopyrimidine deaminase/5-amino-6-(5-phosphoribosylamino)uracil reductase RibD [Zooshikella ganghwensis]